MVRPKRKALTSAISTPEESRVGQVDSRESLAPSSSSASPSVQVLDSNEPLVSSAVPRVQVLDSCEPLAPTPCVQVLDSFEPLVPTAAIPSIGGLIVETPSPTLTMSPVPGCSGTRENLDAGEDTSSGGVTVSPVPGCSHAREDSDAGEGGVVADSPTFTVSWDEFGGTVSRTFTEEPVAGTSASGSSQRRIHLYADEIKNQWNMRKVMATFGTLQSCIQFAENRGLLPRAKMCSYHKKPMTLESSGQLGSFRCRKSNCRNKSVSRAKGTWFQDVHLNLSLVFELMYMFTSGFTYEQVQRETCREDRDKVLSHKTVADWFKYCREAICVYEIEHDEEREQIGGPGKIVKIDESRFGKRKYNRGRQVEGHWVLGMIEDGSDDLRIEVCPENVRSADLVPLIKKHVREGSTIHTDYWRAYDCLPEHGYIHRKVNHSDPENSFVAPDGTHTQRIESHWRGFERAFHKDNYKGNFTHWLIEFSWRRRVNINKLDPFEELLKCIQYVYKI